jgi:hypothetical protein
MNNAQIVETIVSARLANAGIDAPVIPYENALTLPMWNKLGRQIIKDETPTAITVWKCAKPKSGASKTDKPKFYKKTAHIFHECQTKIKGTDTPADHVLLA